MIVAGLVDTVTGKPFMDKAELLGALMGLAKVPAEDAQRTEWKKAGADKLLQFQAAPSKETRA